MSEEDVIVTPQQKLTAILEKMVPIADTLSVKLLRFAIFITLVSIWIAVFCYRLNSIPIGYTGIITCISFIPAAIFYGYYFVLQDILDLAEKTPSFHADIKQSSKNLSEDIKKIKEIKREDINALNLIATGKKIFDLLSLIKSGKSILDQSMSVTFLVSPITLVLLSSALLGLVVLTVLFFVTLVVAIV